MKNIKLTYPSSLNTNYDTDARVSIAGGGGARRGLLARFRSACRTPHAALALLLVSAAGCTLRQAYPQTRISGYINGQPFTVQAPKDSTLTGFDATEQTNGAIHVHIDSLQSALNSTNLASAASGQAAIISATALAVNQAFAAAAAATTAAK